jgi:hypothetical protein
MRYPVCSRSMICGKECLFSKRLWCCYIYNLYDNKFKSCEKCLNRDFCHNPANIPRMEANLDWLKKKEWNLKPIQDSQQYINLDQPYLPRIELASLRTAKIQAELLRKSNVKAIVIPATCFFTNEPGSVKVNPRYAEIDKTLELNSFYSILSLNCHDHQCQTLIAKPEILLNANRFDAIAGFDRDFYLDRPPYIILENMRTIIDQNSKIANELAKTKKTLIPFLHPVYPYWDLQVEYCSQFKIAAINLNSISRRPIFPYERMFGRTLDLRLTEFTQKTKCKILAFGVTNPNPLFAFHSSSRWFCRVIGDPELTLKKSETKVTQLIQGSYKTRWGKVPAPKPPGPGSQGWVNPIYQNPFWDQE